MTTKCPIPCFLHNKNHFIGHLVVILHILGLKKASGLARQNIPTYSIHSIQNFQVSTSLARYLNPNYSFQSSSLVPFQLITVQTDVWTSIRFHSTRFTLPQLPLRIRAHSFCSNFVSSSFHSFLLVKYSVIGVHSIRNKLHFFFL